MDFFLTKLRQVNSAVYGPMGLLNVATYRHAVGYNSHTTGPCEKRMRVTSVPKKRTILPTWGMEVKMSGHRHIEVVDAKFSHVVLSDNRTETTALYSTKTEITHLKRRVEKKSYFS